MPGLLEGWDVSLPSLLIFICVTPSYFPLFLFNPLPYSTLTLLISTLYQCNVSIVNSSFFKRPVENSSKSSSLTTKLRTWWSAVQDANFFLLLAILKLQSLRGYMMSLAYYFADLLVNLLLLLTCTPTDLITMICLSVLHFPHLEVGIHSFKILNSSV